jgi:hypothetical protein
MPPKQNIMSKTSTKTATATPPRAHPSEVQGVEKVSNSTLWANTEFPSASTNLKALSIPTIVKWKDMPVGAVMHVKVNDLVPSQKRSIKNPLMIVTSCVDGTRWALPIVGALAGTFIPGKSRETDLSKVSIADLNPEVIGAEIFIRKSGTKVSKEFKDDNGNDRVYPIFDVMIKAVVDDSNVVDDSAED